MCLLQAAVLRCVFKAAVGHCSGLPTQRPPCLPLLAAQRDGSRGDATRLVELLRNNSVPSDLLEVRRSTRLLVAMPVQGSTLPGRVTGRQ